MLTQDLSKVLSAHSEASHRRRLLDVTCHASQEVADHAVVEVTAQVSALCSQVPRAHLRHVLRNGLSANWLPRGTAQREPKDKVHEHLLRLQLISQVRLGCELRDRARIPTVEAEFEPPSYARRPRAA